VYKGDGFSSKTLGPAGRGSDFWKTSLVSAKILAAAAFLCPQLSKHFNVNWLAPRASKMKQRISCFLTGYS